MVSKAGEEIQDFVRTIVSAVVDHPDQVQVNILESGSVVVVELRTNSGDIGKVIGREGRMAQSLRVLLTAVATKLKKKCVLQILENDQDP